MSDEQWLREGLANAVPEAPMNPARAHAAERLARRRRRTTTLAVAGTAAAVAAIAVVGTSLTSGSGDGPDRDVVANQSDGPVVECPDIEIGKGGTAEGIDSPDPDAPADIPAGATSARLCQGVGTLIQVPPEALTTGVGELVSTINGLEGAGAPDVCTMDLGPGYRIAFGYDDGSTFVVSGQLYGCHTLVVGSTYRVDPEAAQQAFSTLLQEQREASGPQETVSAADLGCDATGGVVLGQGPADISAMVDAIVCETNPDGSSGAATQIEPADLTLLVEDMAANQSNAMLRCALPGPFPKIVGVDEWGQRIEVWSECGNGFWRLPNGMAWMPGDDARAILDGLVSDAS